VNAWRIAGRGCAAAGWILWVVVQVVAKDPFPPEISLSQYGLGGAGWLFSVWVLVLAASPLLLLRYRPVPGPARWLLGLGYFGTVVMAIVRTDEGGLQMSVNAKVHMFGAVLALVFLPLGIVAALRYAAPRWRRLGVALLGAAALVGTLVLLSAAGLDTEGVGPARSWALWQGTLVIIEMLLVGLYAVAVRTVDPGSGRAGLAAPVQSAIR
jgi:Protein of unknown function (DUF998)